MRQEKYFYTHSFPFLFLYSRTGKVQIIGSPTTTLFSSENVPSNFSAKLPVALSRLIALSREAVVVIIFGSNSGPPPALVEKKFIDGEPEIGVAYMHARNSTTRLVPHCAPGPDSTRTACDDYRVSGESNYWLTQRIELRCERFSKWPKLLTVQ